MYSDILKFYADSLQKNHSSLKTLTVNCKQKLLKLRSECFYVVGMEMKKTILCVVICSIVISAKADIAEEITVNEDTQENIFNSLYAGLGIGGSFLKTTYSHLTDVDADRVIGSLVVGGGKVVNKIYGGAEVLFDIAKNKKHVGSNEAYNIRMDGFTPHIGIKAGYVPGQSVLAYLKLGCAWPKVSKYTRADDKTESKTKASFILGVGGEKIFCNRFSTALEVDYNFGFKKDEVRCNKGWNIRALAKYNIKL